MKDIALVYVAGPYSGKNAWETERNVRLAEACAAEIFQISDYCYPILPHANSRPYFAHFKPYAWFCKATMELMRRCDAVVVHGAWVRSAGTKAEVDAAKALGLPTFFWDRGEEQARFSIFLGLWQRAGREQHQKGKGAKL